ncbi:hypothetical protein ABMA28_003391 [Loxostege sticticalis]|uniref:RNA-directed DNA polymerase n=1 Tax=Loxostege sticticalis TaxID=481309 RepID=A0ABD0SVY8_LOXSC
MDVTSLGCPISYLLKDELAHELQIRGFSVELEKSRDDLRKQLTQLIKLHRRGSVCFKPESSECKEEEEIAVCTAKVEAIEKEITGDFIARSAPRLVARCNYLINRLSRLDVSSEGRRNLCSRIISCLAIIDGGRSEASSDDEEEVKDVNVSQSCTKIIYQPAKTYNLNSLNLKFKGDSCVRIFTARLDELIVARDIPEEVVFKGFSDLLDGPALSWYRGNKTSFKNYQEVIDSLVEDFDNPDFDHKLLSKNKYNLTSACDWKQVVPEDSRKEILQKLHDEPSAGHFGVAKTHKRVASHYFWPSMFQDVKKYVAACEICNCYKPINTAQAGLMGQPRQVTQPWEAISCDLMGPLPVSSNRNQFLFVVSDYFSKYTLLFPLRSSVTKHIVKCLEKGVFLLHGTPKIIFCDNGPQFVSKEFQELIKKYNVPHIFYNPRYHPQTNQTERVNRDIGRAIASYVRSDHRKWDQNISEIQCAINTAIHEGTKFSPYSLVHGRDMILDGSLYCSDDPIDPNQVTIVDPTSFSDSLGNLKNIFVSVRANLKRAHEHNSKYYNLRKRPVQLQVGQFAYKRCFPLSSAIKHFSAKLAPKFEKCIISDKHSPVVYSLKSLDGKDLGKFHIKDIVRYD